MPRSLPSPMIAGITGNAVQPCILLDLTLTTGVQHIWSGVGSLFVAGGAQPAVVQFASTFELELPHGTVTTSSPVTAGNLLIGLGTTSYSGSQIGIGFADSLLNTWVTQVPPSPPVQYYFSNGYSFVTHSGSDTVSNGIYGGAGSFLYYTYDTGAEFSGVDTFVSETWANNNNGDSPISITNGSETFASSSSYEKWYANFSIFSMSTNPGAYLYVVRVSLDDGDGLAETIPGWTTFGPFGYYGFYYRIINGGSTYLGVGSLGSIGDINEGVEVKADGTTVTLSGIDPTLLNDCLADIQLGAPATLWFALFSNGAIVGKPYPLFVGTVDRPTIPIGSDTISITLALENRMANLQRPSNRRYTAGDQMYYYPTDSGFNWIETLNDVSLVWGS